MNDYKKPVPIPSVESKPFWNGCKQHQLLLPRCSGCAAYWFPPSALCPKCLSSEWEWVRSAGKGKIYSFGVYHRVYHKGFEGEVPYVLALVQLDEGPRLVSNIVDYPAEDVRCDLPVEVTFDDITDDATLYKFKVVRQAALA